MRNRGLVLLVAMLLLLGLALVLGETVFRREDEAAAPETPDMLLDAVFDRIGVTRWAEAMQWLTLEEAGLLPEDAGPDNPVWVPRSGITYFHSVPLCPGLKNPVETTLQQALEEGRKPCPVCWVMEEADASVSSP